MAENLIYNDRNISLYEDHLILKGYYLLLFGNKRILLSDIEEFHEVRLTYFNGMSRHGHTWLKFRWPFDWKCKSRTEAIYIRLKGKRIGIGIAAEDSRELALALHKKRVNGVFPESVGTKSILEH